MTRIAETDYQKSIAAAVRAEFGRDNNSSITLLAKVIGKSRPTAGGRWHGRTGYTTIELEAIAKHLGISVYDLNESARMSEEFGTREPAVSTPAAPKDSWQQPARAKRRAS